MACPQWVSRLLPFADKAQFCVDTSVLIRWACSGRPISYLGVLLVSPLESLILHLFCIGAFAPATLWLTSVDLRTTKDLASWQYRRPINYWNMMSQQHSRKSRWVDFLFLFKCFSLKHLKRGNRKSLELFPRAAKHMPIPFLRFGEWWNSDSTIFFKTSFIYF